MICLAIKDFVLPASVKIAPGFKCGNIFLLKVQFVIQEC